MRQLAATPGREEDSMSAITPPVEREILDAVRGIRYGSVEVVIHDSQVVQVVRTEKVRMEVRPSTTTGRAKTSAIG
jgi:hypothetical protein